MKRIGHLVALGAACLVVAACGTPAPTEVNHYQMYLPDFPSLLTVHTPVQPPPDHATYVAGDEKEKEQLLTTAYTTQTTNLWTCNIDKDKINSWWQQQSAAVAATNGASAPVAASASQVGQ